MVVATTIAVNMTRMMAPISTVDDVAALIVAKRDLASSRWLRRPLEALWSRLQSFSKALQRKHL